MVNNRWVNFGLLYLGGIVVSLSQLKIVPIQKEVAHLLEARLSTVSWLMAIFTISGIFLSVPGGALVTKLGPKKLLLGLMGCLIVGNVWGYLSQDFTLLLLSRAIEGISFSMIIMVGIVLINDWFHDSHRGLATGIWGTFSAFGSMAAMNVFYPMAKKYGVKAPWLFVAVLAAVLLVLYLFLLQSPRVEMTDEPNADTGLFRQGTRNRKLWLLALAQGCMSFVLFTFINIYPLLYTQQYHLSELIANRYAGYFGLFGIPFGALAGYLIDKTKKGHFIILASFMLMTLSALAANYMGTTGSFLSQSLALSAGAGLSSACVMTLTPSVVTNPRLIGASISFVNFIYYIGIFIGTPLTTKIAERSDSWHTGIWLLSAVGLIGFLLTAGFVRINRLEKEQEKQLKMRCNNETNI